MKLVNKIFLKYNNSFRKPYGYEPNNIVLDFQKNIETIIHEWNNYVAINNQFGNPIDEYSKEQIQLNKDKKWKALFLFVYSVTNPEMLQYFPETFKLINRWKHRIGVVFFSSMEPGKRIPPHNGNNHSVLRVQFGISIPEPENTGLKVEDKEVHLKAKEFFIFDDTYLHEAWNNGETVRTVLIIDFHKRKNFFFNVLNRLQLRSLRKSEYVQSVLNKITNTVNSRLC